MSKTGYIDWRCKRCNTINEGFTLECFYCGESRYSAIDPNNWPKVFATPVNKETK